jgi:hypothetical protein
MFGLPKAEKSLVTNGRFELEQDGKTAYLEYSLGNGVIVLSHTEVPPELRHHGIAQELAKSALDWARENRVKVDVVCSSVAAFIEDNPQYADLVIK